MHSTVGRSYFSVVTSFESDVRVIGEIVCNMAEYCGLLFFFFIIDNKRPGADPHLQQVSMVNGLQNLLDWFTNGD